MTAQTVPIEPAEPMSTRQKVFPWLVILGIPVVFIVLMLLNQNSLMFPLWSALAYPLLAAAPFAVVGLKLPGTPRQVTAFKTLVILVTLLLLVPALGFKNSSYLYIATQVGIFATLALGLNIVVGFAGLLDLGYVAFFAVGAYLWASVSSQSDTFIKLAGFTAPAWSFYLFFFAAIILAAITGILLGLPVLRLRGDYLAIVTLAFGEMIRVLASNLDHPVNITNGSQGLVNVGAPPIPPIIVNGLTQLNTNLALGIDNVQPIARLLWFYLLVLVICGFVMLIASRLDNSPIGRAWTAIREDETAAIAMGVPLVRMKLLAFAMGASFAGAMGAVFAAQLRNVSPESFSFMESIGVLAMVIVGGMGSIRGVMLGAAIVTLLNLQFLQGLSLVITNLKNIDWVVPILNFPIRSWPSQLELAKYQRFVFGILLVIMMIARPTGILPASRRKLEIQEKLGGDEPPLEPDTAAPLTDSMVTQPGESTNVAGS